MDPALRKDNKTNLTLKNTREQKRVFKFDLSL